MTDDVSIVVGIRGDDSGGRVIKKSLDDIAASGEKAQSSTDRLKAAVDKGNSGWKEASSYVVNYKAALEKGYITQERYNQLVGRSSKGMQELSGITAGTTREFLVLGREAITGNFSRIPGSLIVLAQRMNSLTKIVGSLAGLFTGPLAIGVGLATAAFAAIALHINAVEKELNRLNVAFLASGNGAAFNAGEMEKYVDRLDALAGVSKKDAVDSQVALAGTLGMTKDRLAELNALLPDVAAGLGKSVPDAAKFLAEAMNDPAAASKKLNEEYQLLTPSQNEAMRAMQDLGDKAGEQALLIEALGGRFKDLQEKSLSPMQAIIQGISMAWDDAGASIGKYIDKLNDLEKNSYWGGLNGKSTQKAPLYSSPAMDGPVTQYKAINDQLLQAQRLTDGLNLKEEQRKKLQGDLTQLQTGEQNALKLGNDQLADRFRLAQQEVSERIKSLDYNSTAQKAVRAQKKVDNKELSDALKAEKKQQDEITSAIKGSRTEEEKLNDEIANLERLKGFATTKDQVDKLNDGIKNTQAELEKLRVKAELNSPTAKAFASLASEIDDGFKDAFKDAFTASDGGFKKLIEGWKNTFKNFLAELAYQALVRPIVLSIVGGIGGSMGLSSGAVASVLGNVTGAPGIAGGGTGGFSLTSLGGLFSKGLSGTTSGIGTSFGTGIGKLFGMDAYSSLELGDKFGAFLGSAGSTANLLAGAGGGIAASLLGLGSKNAYVNAGLSTVGGLAGSAFGPIGTFAGSFLGSALGGLFGGGKPTDGTQGGGVDLSTGDLIGVGGMTGKKYSAANASFRDSVLAEASNLSKLFQSVGATTSGRVDVAVGSRDGLRLNTYDENGVRNFGNNSQAFIDAIMQAVLKGTTGLTGTFKAIVDKLGVSDTKKLADAFEFGKQFDEFVNQTEKTPVDTLNEALKVLNDNLANLQQQATDLGLPTDKLTESYNKQKDALLNSIKAQMAGYQSLDDMNRAFDNFFNGQALSSNSSLTPMQKLQAAQSTFGGLLTKAQGGDLSVTPDLLSAASSLIDQGRDVYASSVDFSNLEGFVRSSVQGVANTAGYSGQNVAYSIVSTNQQLVQQGNDQTQAIQDMKAEIYRLSNKIAALTDKVA